MNVKVEIKGGYEQSLQYIKKAMLITQGKKPINPDLSEITFKSLLLSGDSPAKEFEFWITIEGLSDRVHTHIVRHERIGKYVSSSRPDLTNSDDKTRKMIIKIDALRMIEIMKWRYCSGKVWKETKTLFEEIRRLIITQYPVFDGLFYPPCVYNGFCPMGSRFCGKDYKKEKIEMLTILKDFIR